MPIHQEQKKDYSKDSGFTLETLKHPKYCYISYRGEVYNVTRYLSEHPGGANILNRANGHEIAETLDDSNHKDAHFILNSTHVERIGILLDGYAPVSDSLAAERESRKQISLESTSTTLQESPKEHDRTIATSIFSIFSKRLVKTQNLEEASASAANVLSLKPAI